ncbi:MAG TPA: hypothetical protein VEI02_16595 [Planctomycetota bacterium]|nr:hypothetical protein [Planctomycetota bacterium]
MNLRRAWLPALLLAGCASGPESSEAVAAPRESRPAPDPFAALAAKYDRDGDGRITAEEHARGAEAFRNLDRDGDGVVARADFERPVSMPASIAAPYLAVRLIGGADATSVGPDDVDDAFADLDLDGDGALSAAEGATVREDGFATLAAAVDADRDGKLGRDEMKAWIEARDRDGDGRVALRERTAPGPEPRVGRFPPGARDVAPEFRLRRRDGGGHVALSDFRGRTPVALIFGSFT